MNVTNTSEEAEPADELIERIIDEAQPLFLAQRHAIARVWQDRSVSKLNLHLLILLEANGPQTMSQLAALADVALPNLTGIIDRMVERDLVGRERDEDDRRVVVIRSTDKGRSYVEQLEAARREGLREILEGLDPDARRVCLRAMRLMGHEAQRIRDRDHGLEHRDPDHHDPAREARR